MNTKTKLPRYFLTARSLFLALVVFLTLLLSGCVHYDLGINFQGLHRGTIVQHIELSEQLTKFSQADTRKWLDSIKKRARRLGGKMKKVSPQEVIVTIPFSSGPELQDKFLKFFNPSEDKVDKLPQEEDLDLVKLNADMQLQQSNFLLLQRNKLSLDLDLRALAVVNSSSNVVLSPGSLVDLDFSLNSPWGVRNLDKTNSATVPQVKDENSLNWQLQPGEINHIEAIFWLPSYLGIGALVIIFLVLVGAYLKDKYQPEHKQPEVARVN